MKLLFVVNDLIAGGSERVITNLCNGFSDMGHEVVLAIYSDRPTISYKLNENVRIVSPKKFFSKNNFFKKIQQIIFLREQFKHFRPHKVISFLTETNITTALSMVGIKADLFVSERNNPYVDPTSKLWRVLRNIIYNSKLITGFVFQTVDAQGYFSNSIIGKSKIIMNPIEKNLPKVVHKRKKRIVTVGRLYPQKNHKLLIKAFSNLIEEFPDFHLYIYGEGYLRDSLEQYSKELGNSENIVFKGVVKNIPNEIKDATLFVLPSDYEGMSNALIEAYAMGIPTISTDCPIGGSKELVNMFSIGTLTKVGDEKDMTDAIRETLCCSNKKVLESIDMSDNIRQRLSLNEILQQWSEFMSVH